MQAKAATPTSALSESSMGASWTRNRARHSSRPTRTSKTSGRSCRPRRNCVDHIGTFKRLAQLYAAVRNAYADKVGFVADLAYKTRRLVEESATQEGLGRLTKSITFDVKTLEALRVGQGL